MLLITMRKVLLILNSATPSKRKHVKKSGPWHNRCSLGLCVSQASRLGGTISAKAF